MNQPYESLDKIFFWSPAVAQKNMFSIDQLWNPKFDITKEMNVTTYGSCFAQHIGNALKHAGFKWLIAERAPSTLNDESRKKFNYDVFSSRTGNIYTTSLLKQWVEWSLGVRTPPREVWEQQGRFYDPFRPNIEPNGFASAKELYSSRDMALAAFKKSFVDANVFIFTLGLTESWWNALHDYEYPMCPGTIAGSFDSALHTFTNQQYEFIKKNLLDAIKLMRQINPTLKFILTVSPVPLTATYSGNHVLLATIESKSILRAVAGALSKQFQFIDYFPSYEIISAFPYRAIFFESNLRSVTQVGVQHVMKIFFNSLLQKYPFPITVQAETNKVEINNRAIHDSDVICEEAILASFSKAAK